MSAESYEWLNSRTLIGFTESRGNAWHYREDLQGSEPNHYIGAIPVDDVLRRLFNFQLLESPLYIKPDENDPLGFYAAEGFKAVYTSDTLDTLGIFKEGYKIHQYDRWLVDEVSAILDASDLGIGSAGLLANRARAWVSIEVPENVTTPEGVEFRPHLVAAGSCDGSLSTTYKRTVTNVVCDNTLSASLSEKGQQLKVKHTRYSELKLANAREALAIVYTLADDFAAEVARLCAWKVSPFQWSSHLDLVCAVPETEGKARSIADVKRQQLRDLWARDERVAPWSGTAWGVLQAHNTWRHHLQGVRGTSRQLRNQENAIGSRNDEADLKILESLALVCV